MPRNHGCISNHLKNHDLYTTSWCHWCRGGMIRSLRPRDVSPGWVGKGTQWRIRNGAGGEKASRFVLVHCCLGRPVSGKGGEVFLGKYSGNRDATKFKSVFRSKDTNTQKHKSVQIRRFMKIDSGQQASCSLL